MRRLIIVNRQAHLFEVVAALRAPRRFPRLLHGRQQQRDQDGDNRDDDQQFDEGEAQSYSITDPHRITPAPQNIRSVEDRLWCERTQRDPGICKPNYLRIE